MEGFSRIRQVYPTSRKAALLLAIKLEIVVPGFAFDFSEATFHNRSYLFFDSHYTFSPGGTADTDMLFFGPSGFVFSTTGNFLDFYFPTPDWP